MKTDGQTIKIRNKILTVITLVVLLLFVGNSMVLGANSTEMFVEKIAEIEIWAKTFIDLTVSGDTIRAVLSMDNGTVIPEQELDFYLDENSLNSEITNSEGYVEVFFGDYNLSVGNYSFKSVFQGNQTLFFNASFTEKQIEILNQDGVRWVRLIEQEDLDKGIVELNETEEIIGSYLFVRTDKQTYVRNETVIISGGVIGDEYANGNVELEILFEGESIFVVDFDVVEMMYNYSLIADFEKEGEYVVMVSLGNLSNQTNFYFSNASQSLDLEGFVCKEFTDSVLFSSGYTHDEEGSTNYETWRIQTNCSDAGGENCLLHNVNVKTRIRYLSSQDIILDGEAYVQLSQLSNSACDSPQRGSYAKYLIHDVLVEEGEKIEEFCGNNKNLNSDCGVGSLDNFQESSMCYGIKTYASQDSIVDVLEVRYSWCWMVEDE